MCSPFVMNDARSASVIFDFLPSAHPFTITLLVQVTAGIRFPVSGTMPGTDPVQAVIFGEWRYSKAGVRR